MTLDEWVEEQKKQLDKFRDYWKKQQVGGNTEFFPEDMPPGEWDEQFRLWEPGEAP